MGRLLSKRTTGVNRTNLMALAFLLLLPLLAAVCCFHHLPRCSWPTVDAFVADFQHQGNFKSLGSTSNHHGRILTTTLRPPLSPTTPSYTRYRKPDESLTTRSMIPHLPGRAYASRAFASTAVTATSANELALLAFEWCVFLGAPAALVAGTTVATLYENVRQGALDVYEDDTPYVAFAKKVTNLLLVGAFGLQIVSIFVTSVMATVLMTRDFTDVPLMFGPTIISTPLGFLRKYFEFEYLTARICFLQGLTSWLAGVALEHTIPRANEGRAGREMDQFVASALSALLVLLLSFYNAHLTHYDNYLQMLWRWGVLFGRRFVSIRRPLAFLYLPLMGVSLFAGMRLLWPEKDGNLKRRPPKDTKIRSKYLKKAAK